MQSVVISGRKTTAYFMDIRQKGRVILMKKYECIISSGISYFFVTQLWGVYWCAQVSRKSSLGARMIARGAVSMRVGQISKNRAKKKQL